MPPTPTQRLGIAGERLALEHYQRLGFELLDRRYRTRDGEIDLVVRTGGTVVFVEVKTARAGAMDPFEWITARKQLRMRRVARRWLAACDTRWRDVRFDAVGVVVDSGGRLRSLEQREGVL